MILDALPLFRMVRSFTGFAKELGITGEHFNKIHQSANEVLQRSDVLTLPDRFNDAFARKGWVATGAMSAKTMRTVLELKEAGKNQQAENELLGATIRPLFEGEQWRQSL